MPLDTEGLLVEVLERLAGLENGVTGIHSRLDRLNGSVARHEEAIAKLKQDHATHEAKDEEKQKSSGVWEHRLTPFVMGFLGLLFGLILAHAKDFVRGL